MKNNWAIDPKLGIFQDGLSKGAYIRKKCNIMICAIYFFKK